MKQSSRKITITIKRPWWFNKKLTYPIEELIPDLPEYIGANNHKVAKAVTTIATEGFELKGTKEKMTWVPPSRIVKIELNFPQAKA
jgi:hypothetical protein